MTYKEFQLTVVSLLSEITNSIILFGDRKFLRKDAEELHKRAELLKQIIEEKHRDKSLDESIMGLNGKEARGIE